MALGAVIILLPGRSGGWNVGDLLIVCATLFPPFGNVFAQRARRMVAAVLTADGWVVLEASGGADTTTAVTETTSDTTTTEGPVDELPPTGPDTPVCVDPVPPTDGAGGGVDGSAGSGATAPCARATRTPRSPSSCG